eukprot:COSAG02_NODE_61306_length_269_cov_0.594118_1_plen_57_part_10
MATVLFSRWSVFGLRQGTFATVVEKLAGIASTPQTTVLSVLDVAQCHVQPKVAAQTF